MLINNNNVEAWLFIDSAIMLQEPRNKTPCFVTFMKHKLVKAQKEVDNDQKLSIEEYILEQLNKEKDTICTKSRKRNGMIWVGRGQIYIPFEAVY